ncbi:arsenic resistance protein ArsH [Akanthomyces lecanii RCEF 1005]|uniref:Arsenic resistance protein ArsH n=1 Tax=Akanthomyces lecanii RCEF 1005 TaxID=1081108 RepID=A0A162KPY0_CORDF|nr:arsenic resistance protein ArsH [Akanthomyces lecanii RCEF 1005]
MTADSISGASGNEKPGAQLRLSADQDEQEIRDKYRPFLRHFPRCDGSDWIEDLELDTVTEMARANLARTGSRLKVLVLYGSLRKRSVDRPMAFTCTAFSTPAREELTDVCNNRSYSRLTAYEAARILHRLGCDVRVFDPTLLPIRDSVPPEHPAVQELRALSFWSDGHVWCAPEQHGNLTAVFKNQIDWIPLSTGSVRPTQGRTLSVVQVNGGSQSFNTVNSLRVLGRWMRMFTIPNQSSIPMAYKQFENEGGDGSGEARLLPGGNRDRLVDCMEEFVKYTIIMREHFGLFGDRYSERKESAAKATQAFSASALK